MSTSTTQCAATLQRKPPLQKGKGVYQEQENFWRDWKLHNNIIDLLSSDKVGFRTVMDQRWVQTIEPGKELDRAQRKSCATLCLLNDGSVWRIEEFIFQSFTQLTHEQYHDRFVETQAWLSPSAKSVWHFTSFSLFFLSFLCMFAAEMQHYPTVLQRKTSIQCLEHRSARACGEPDNLFFWPKLLFFSPSRLAFGVLMWRETKKIIAVALHKHSSLIYHSFYHAFLSALPFLYAPISFPSSALISFLYTLFFLSSTLSLIVVSLLSVVNKVVSLIIIEDVRIFGDLPEQLGVEASDQVPSR